jgi:hypothetical protein
MTQYPSHRDQTVSYLQQYLREFHANKAIFLRFHADKKTKKVAAEAHKTLLKKQVGMSVAGLTASEKVKFRQGNNLERRELVDEILTEGAHYNQRAPRVEYSSNRLAKNRLGHRVFPTTHPAESVPSSHPYTRLIPDSSPSCQAYLALLHSPPDPLSLLSGPSAATLTMYRI